MTTQMADPNSDTESRHYMGLWHVDISETSDLLGCAWQEEGQWHVRFRFRHDLGFPVFYETRFERRLGSRGEGQARAFMEGACLAASVLDNPITYEPVEGGVGKAIKTVFGKRKLLGWTLDDQTLPIVPEAAAKLLNQIFIEHCLPRCESEVENLGRRKFEQVLASSAQLPQWQSNHLGFWVLDAIGVGADCPAAAMARHVTLERREKWTSWACERAGVQV